MRRLTAAMLSLVGISLPAAAQHTIEFVSPSSAPVLTPAAPNTFPTVPEAAAPEALPSSSAVPNLPSIPIAETAVPLPPQNLSAPTISGNESLPPLPEIPSLPVTAQPAPPPPQAVPVAQPIQHNTGEVYTYQRNPAAAPMAALPTVRGQLAAGTTLPLTVYRPMTFPPFQAIQANLAVAQPILDSQGQVLIPAGSVLWGTFDPIVEEQVQTLGDNGYERIRRKVVGTRFVAERITVGTATYPVRGESGPLSVSFDPDADVGTVALRGAGVGAAGGIAFGVLTGGLGFLPALAVGGLGGAAAGLTNVDQVVALQPNAIVPVVLSEALLLQ